MELTTHERFLRMFNHKEADRIPIIDKPWRGTLARWQREGMPGDVDWRDYFGVDKVENISVNITPRYERQTLEETEDYIIARTPWGATVKSFKHADSTPEFLDFEINNRQAWQRAKERMTPDPSRVNWKNLEDNYGRWRAEGRWVQAAFWFGFDVTHSWTVGTETLLMAMIEEPDWVEDMFDHYLTMCIAHFDMIWERGYRFDSISWPDDMGYKNTTFFSPAMYRQLVKPYHRRAADWAHAKGIKAHLHSCGYIMPFVPDIIDAGIDALNPIEIKAGMDVVKLKKEYGDKLVLHGGINAIYWDQPDKITEEIEKVVPVLKENGGYIFSSDHSIPNSVSLNNFQYIVSKVKELGSYQ